MPPTPKVRRLAFPAGGLDKSQSIQTQRPFTSTDMDNVWPESQEDRRERGGSRPGLVKAFSDQISGANQMDLLAELSYINSSKANTRQLVGASNGTLAYWESGSTWTNVTTTRTLKSGTLLQATSHLQKLYIADYSTNFLYAGDGAVASDGKTFTSATFSDWTSPGGSFETPNATDYVLVINDVNGDTSHADVGVHVIAQITGVGNSELEIETAITPNTSSIDFYFERDGKIYDPAADTLTRWTATSGRGQTPVGNHLVCTWQDRVVLAGGHDAPHLWHMSKLGDPLDWVTTDPTETTAVTGLSDDLGQIGEPITALIPWQDYTLLIAGQNEIWALTGNPAAGGSMRNLSYEHGILGGKAWCRTNKGELIFLSKNGLFGMADPRGSAPYPISRERIPDDLLFADDSSKTVLLEYDKLNRKVLIFIV